MSPWRCSAKRLLLFVLCTLLTATRCWSLRDALFQSRYLPALKSDVEVGIARWSRRGLFAPVPFRVRGGSQGLGGFSCLQLLDELLGLLRGRHSNDALLSALDAVLGVIEFGLHEYVRLQRRGETVSSRGWTYSPEFLARVFGAGTSLQSQTETNTLYEFMAQAGFSFDKDEEDNELLAYPTETMDEKTLQHAQGRLQSAMQEARRAAAASAASRRARTTVQPEKTKQDKRAPMKAVTPSSSPSQAFSQPHAPAARSTDPVAMLQEEMKRAADEMRFEDAIKLREAIAVLQSAGAGAAGGGSAEQHGGAHAQGQAPPHASPPPTTEGASGEHAGQTSLFDELRKQEWSKVRQQQQQQGGRSAQTKSMWDGLLGSDAGMADEEEEEVDPKDAVMQQMLKEAREAMNAPAQDIDFAKIAKEVDAAVGKLEKAAGGDSYLESALQLMIQVLTKISAQPSQEALRRINVAGSAFVGATGPLGTACRHVLQAVGFEEQRGSDTLVLPEEAPLFTLREATGTLQLALDRLHGQDFVGMESDSEKGAEEALTAEQREPVVLTPSEQGGDPPAQDVPDEVYEFTARDLITCLESNSGTRVVAMLECVRASMLERAAVDRHLKPCGIGRRQLEKAQRLVTSKTREKDVPQHSDCAVRVRFSDGSLLQGKFGARETVPALYSGDGDSSTAAALAPCVTAAAHMTMCCSFVTGCLREPSLAFELKTPPPVRVLAQDTTETFKQLGMVPSGTVNLKWKDNVRRGKEVIHSSISVKPMQRQ